MSCKDEACLYIFTRIWFKLLWEKIRKSRNEALEKTKTKLVISENQFGLGFCEDMKLERLKIKVAPSFQKTRKITVK